MNTIIREDNIAFENSSYFVFKKKEEKIYLGHVFWKNVIFPENSNYIAYDALNNIKSDTKTFKNITNQLELKKFLLSTDDTKDMINGLYYYTFCKINKDKIYDAISDGKIMNFINKYRISNTIPNSEYEKLSLAFLLEPYVNAEDKFMCNYLISSIKKDDLDYKKDNSIKSKLLRKLGK